MPPLSGQPSYITEPKTWDIDLLAYVPLEVSTSTAPPSYDSGRVTLPDALTVLTGSTIRARGVHLCNVTAAGKTVTVTNTAGDFYLKDFPLQAGMSVYVDLGGSQMVGVKWNASAAASVTAQLVGD